MYEFLPPVLRYAVLAALYLFLFMAYRGLRGALNARQLATPRPTLAIPPAGAGGRPAALTVIAAGDTSSAVVGHEVLLLTSNIIGREAGCTFVVDDRFASKRHAAVEYRDGDYVLTDLGSSNGTFLNGVQVLEPIALADGDYVEIGSTAFEYRA